MALERTIQICNIPQLAEGDHPTDNELFAMDKKQSVSTSTDAKYTTASVSAKQIKSYIFDNDLNQNLNVTFGTATASIDATGTGKTADVPTVEDSNDGTSAASTSWVRKFWTNVKANDNVTISGKWTFSGNQTFNGAITTALSSERVVVTSASKNLSSSTVKTSELGYLTGATSNIQTQLNAKAPSASPTFSGSITTAISGNRVVVTNSSKQLTASSITTTELGYLSGVTSNIQSQLGSKAVDSNVVHRDSSETITGEKTFQNCAVKYKNTNATRGTTTTDDIYFSHFINTDKDGNYTIEDFNYLSADGENRYIKRLWAPTSENTTCDVIHASINSAGKSYLSTSANGVYIGNANVPSFIRAIGNGSQIQAKFLDIDALNTPTANVGYNSLIVYDTNDYEIGTVYSLQRSDGYFQNSLRACAIKDDKETYEVKTIAVGVKKDGSWYTYAPTPETGDSSTKIATTEWVSNQRFIPANKTLVFCLETNKHQTYMPRSIYNDFSETLDYGTSASDNGDQRRAQTKVFTLENDSFVSWTFYNENHSENDANEILAKFPGESVWVPLSQSPDINMNDTDKSIYISTELPAGTQIKAVPGQSEYSKWSGRQFSYLQTFSALYIYEFGDKTTKLYSPFMYDYDYENKIWKIFEGPNTTKFWYRRSASIPKYKWTHRALESGLFEYYFNALGIRGMHQMYKNHESDNSGTYIGTMQWGYWDGSIWKRRMNVKSGDKFSYYPTTQGHDTATWSNNYSETTTYGFVARLELNNRNFEEVSSDVVRTFVSSDYYGTTTISTFSYTFSKTGLFNVKIISEISSNHILLPIYITHGSRDDFIGFGSFTNNDGSDNNDFLCYVQSGDVLHFGSWFYQWNTSNKQTVTTHSLNYLKIQIDELTNYDSTSHAYVKQLHYNYADKVIQVESTHLMANSNKKISEFSITIPSNGVFDVYIWLNGLVWAWPLKINHNSEEHHFGIAYCDNHDMRLTKYRIKAYAGDVISIDWDNGVNWDPGNDGGERIYSSSRGDITSSTTTSYMNYALVKIGKESPYVDLFDSEVGYEGQSGEGGYTVNMNSGTYDIVIIGGGGNTSDALKTDGNNSWYVAATGGSSPLLHGRFTLSKASSLIVNVGGLDEDSYCYSSDNSINIICPHGNDCVLNLYSGTGGAEYVIDNSWTGITHVGVSAVSKNNGPKGTDANWYSYFSSWNCNSSEYANTAYPYGCSPAHGNGTNGTNCGYVRIWKS